MSFTETLTSYCSAIKEQIYHIAIKHITKSITFNTSTTTISLIPLGEDNIWLMPRKIYYWSIPLRSFRRERRGSSTTSDTWQSKYILISQRKHKLVCDNMHYARHWESKPDDKYKCGVFCFESNNLLAITYKTVKKLEKSHYILRGRMEGIRVESFPSIHAVERCR